MISKLQLPSNLTISHGATNMTFLHSPTTTFPLTKFTPRHPSRSHSRSLHHFHQNITTRPRQNQRHGPRLSAGRLVGTTS